LDKAIVLRYLNYIGRWLGFGLTALSFWYIYSILKSTAISFPDKSTFEYLFLILFFVFANSLAPFIATCNWKLLLEFIGNKKIRYKDACDIYIKSNIAKYLPGNVLQYAGRNIIGKKYGWTNTQLFASSILEIICALFVPFLILASFYIFKLWWIPKSFNLSFRSGFNLAFYAILSVGILCIIIFIYKKELIIEWLTKIKIVFPLFLTKKFAKLIFKTINLSLLNFFINGVIFFLIAHCLNVSLKYSDFINISCGLTLASYSVIFTPGVPGGIGVKESISTALILNYGYSSGEIASVLIACRIFSILGDISAYFIIMLARYSNSK